MSKFQTSLNNQVYNVPITTVSSSYTALSTDYIIEVVGQTSAVTITLPQAATTGTTPNLGKIYTIIDGTGLANNYPINIVAVSTLVSGQGSVNLTVPNSSVQVVCDGTSYQVLSITNPIGSLYWQQASGTGPYTINASNGFYSINASLTTFALPTTNCFPGTIIAINGVGAGGWKLTQSAGQQIFLGQQNTTFGTSGFIQGLYQGASIHLLCTTTNLTWYLLNSFGNIIYN